MRLLSTVYPRSRTLDLNPGPPVLSKPRQLGWDRTVLMSNLKQSIILHDHLSLSLVGNCLTFDTVELHWSRLLTRIPKPFSHIQSLVNSRQSSVRSCENCRISLTNGANLCCVRDGYPPNIMENSRVISWIGLGQALPLFNSSPVVRRLGVCL